MRLASTLHFLAPATLVGFANLVSGHASIFHPSMLGFNVSFNTQPFNYDNRPVSPLTNYTFDQWWMHGHLAFPPHPEDIFELPAGQNVTTEIACTKSATSFHASSDGGDIQNGDDPCPGSPPSEYHTNGPDDLKGCALAIAYKDDFNTTKPEDFTVFSVNQTCVFHRFTNFAVPERMPACPNGKCICAWFWIHSEDSGGEQNYMTAFQCSITKSTSNIPLATPVVPRRCGADPKSNRALPAPGNCTFGAKQPFYWFQAERNNMFEGTYSPPFYLDLYNFKDGAQDDIFQDSYATIPTPSDNQTELPILKTVVRGQTLPIPDLHLLPSGFLASVQAAAPAPTLFKAGTVIPLAPASSSQVISTSLASSAGSSPSTILASTSAIPTTSSTSSSSSATATSRAVSGSFLAPVSAITSPISSSQTATATVTVTNVVTVVIELEPSATGFSSSAPTESALSTNKTASSLLGLLPGSVLIDTNSTTLDSTGVLQNTNPDTTGSQIRTCKQSTSVLSAQSRVAPGKRSLAQRLGMGTYMYRQAHKRGLWAWW